MDMSKIVGIGSDRTQKSYIDGDTDPSYLYLIKISELVNIGIEKLCFEKINTDELPKSIGKYAKNYIVEEPKNDYKKLDLETRVKNLEHKVSELEKRVG